MNTQQILVPFEGDGAGVGELTWGQHEILAAMDLQGSLAVGDEGPLAEGTTVDEVATVMRFIMGRHQSLRTRYLCDANGRPRQQEVCASGQIPLTIVDVDDADDPARVSIAMAKEYERTGYDHANEWPLRMAVIRHRGVLTRVVAMYSHLSIDAYGLDALMRDLGNLDRATGRELAPVAGTPPLEQALEQATPSALRQSEAAMRHWERQLRKAPSRRFTGSARAVGHVGQPEGRPRYWRAKYRSPAMHLALRRLADLTGAETSTLLLAAYAVALARLTGNSRSLIREVVSNRFRPGLAESVSVTNQTGLCVIDVADAGFDEVVTRAWRSSLGGRLHAYYDPRRLKEVVAALGQERGEELDVSCFLNDRRRLAGVEEAIPTPQDIQHALARSTLEWLFRRDQPTDRLFVDANNVPGLVDLRVSADTHHVSPTDLEELIHGLEAVTVEAAFDPKTPAMVARSALR